MEEDSWRRSKRVGIGVSENEDITLSLCWTENSWMGMTWMKEIQIVFGNLKRDFAQYFLGRT